MTTTKAIEAVRTALHKHCKDMGPEDYMEVLATLAADIEGNMDALKEENEELFG